MNVNDFFILDDKGSGETLQAHPLNLPLILRNKKQIEHILLLMGNYSEFELPIIFKHEYGKRLDDIIKTGYSSLHLISNRFKQVLEEGHFTGWKTFPVKVLNKKGIEIEGYHGLSVTGRCGPVDWDKSQIIQKPFLKDGPLARYYKGFYVDHWDGSDFFIPEEYYTICVTKRVAETLVKAKLTNIQLVNFAEFTMWVEAR